MEGVKGQRCVVITVQSQVVRKVAARRRRRGGSERLVLLSGGGVSGGADGVPVPSGADNLILKRRDRRDQSVIDLQRHSQ